MGRRCGGQIRRLPGDQFEIEVERRVKRDGVEVPGAAHDVPALRHRLVDSHLPAERGLDDSLRGIGVAVVILRTGPQMRREVLAIDEDFFIPLPVPGGDRIEQRQRIADIDTAAVEAKKVPVARWRRRQPRLLVPCGVKVHRAVVPSPWGDGGVERDADGLVAQVLEGDAGGLLVRHRPPT